MERIGRSLVESFREQEQATQSTAHTIRIETVCYARLASDAATLDVPVAEFLSAYIRWLFDYPVIGSEFDGDRVWAIFENVGETTDTIRDDRHRMNRPHQLIIHLPDSFLRQIRAAQQGVGAMDEDFIGDFINAIFGFEGSEKFEQWVAFAGSVSGRIQPSLSI